MPLEIGHDTSVFSESTCDNCHTDIDEYSSVYCGTCFDGSPAHSQWLDWLRDLADDLRLVGVPPRLLERVTDRRDDLMRRV